jgi:hypothetical protein
MKGKTDGKTGKWLQTSLPKKRTIQFLLDGVARLGEPAFRVAFGRRLHDGVFGMLRQYQLGCNGSFPNNCSSVQSLILWNRDDDDAEEEEGDKEESHNHPDIVVFCVHTDSQKDPPALIFFAVPGYTNGSPQLQGTFHAQGFPQVFQVHSQGFSQEHRSQAQLARPLPPPQLEPDPEP